MLSFFRENRSLIWVVGGLAMAGLVLSMVGTGVNLGTFGSGMSRGTAAVVGPETITVQELMIQINRQKEQMQASMEQYLGAEASKNRDFVNQLLKAQLRPERVLNDLVNRKVFVMTAKENGAVASNAAVKKALADIPAFQNNGKFDPLTYKQVLSANGLSPGTFENDVKEQVLVQSFQDSFLAGLSQVSENEKQALLEASKVYNFETLSVDSANFANPTSLTENQVQEFIAQKDSSSKIEQYYNLNRSKYEKPEELRARHILIKGDQAETKIKDIREKILSKALSFENAAKQFSEDPSNAAKGGDLGFFAKGMMDPAFESAAFALSKKEPLSAPVKSSFGWHLIEFVEKQEAQKTNLEAVKIDIARQLALEQAREEQAKRWVQGYVEKGQAPSELDAKSVGLKWETQSGWSPMEPRLGSLGSVEAHLNEMLSLNEQNPFLKKALPFGKKLVLVKFKSVSMPQRDPGTPWEADKAGEAFGFYIDQVRKAKEAQKDIKISQEALKIIETQMQQSGL